jgi:hypothetical protein
MIDEHGDIKKDRQGKAIPRPPKIPTPCSSCPREKPANEVATTLSEKNIKAYLFAMRNDGMHGHLLAGWMALARRLPDEITQAVLSIVAETKHEVERAQMLRAMTLSVASAAAGR